MRTTTLATLLASISFICAEPTSFKLFHRLYQPTEEQTSFSERGLLLLSEDNVLSFQPSPSYVRDLNAFAQALRTASDSIDLALYQVALEREGDVKQWDISSVKVVCIALLVLTVNPEFSLPTSVIYTKSHLSLSISTHSVPTVTNPTLSIILFLPFPMKVPAQSQHQRKILLHTGPPSMHLPKTIG